MGHVGPFPLVIAKTPFLPDLPVPVVGDVIPVEFPVLEAFLFLQLAVPVIEEVLALEFSVLVVVLLLPKLPRLIVGGVLADEPVLLEGALLPDPAVAIIGNRLPVPLPVFIGHPQEELPVFVIRFVRAVELPFEAVALFPELPLSIVGDVLPILPFRGKEIPVHGYPVFSFLRV